MHKEFFGPKPDKFLGGYALSRNLYSKFFE